MSKQLPKQPSLEHLKNEAKALLRLAKQGDPETLKKVGQAKLADAQLAVARDYGFASWSKLKRQVEGFTDNREAFFAAIRAGDRERVKTLLDENPHLVRSYDPNSFGAVPIGVAAERSDKPMIDLLLQRGADIDARSDWGPGGFRALDLADEETSQFLLKKGATLTAHAAARLGMATELKAILTRNPGVVNERGGDGQYPLHFAKTAEIVDILLDAGADIEARDIDHEGTPLQYKVNDAEVRERLFERGAKTDIFSAIALNNLELVKKHLAEDPEALTRSVERSGNPMIPQPGGRHIYSYTLGPLRPYQVAIKLQRKEIYEYLVSQSRPSEQLLAAFWKGDHEAAKEVLTAHPGLVKDLSLEERNLIAEAARLSRSEAVEAMLKAGFDVNHADHEGMSAIHWASFHGRDDMVEMILPYKPDLEKKNVYGGTVLRTGIYGSMHGWYPQNNYARSTELLIQAGAELPDELYGSPDVQAVLKKYGVQ